MGFVFRQGPAATFRFPSFPVPAPPVYFTRRKGVWIGELGQGVTNEAPRMHGHYGYTRAFPLERMVRDARGYSVAGGRGEIPRKPIASMVFR